MTELRNFDAEWGRAEPKQFILRGHTFTLMPDLPPDVFARYQDMADTVGQGMTNTMALELLDDVVLTCLTPDCHDAWREVRALRDENVVGLNRMNELIQYMIEEITGRPFTSAPISTPTAGTAASETRSTASSDSPPAADSATPLLRSARAST